MSHTPRFKVGDIVVLKSGGPRMTVNNPDVNAHYRERSSTPVVNSVAAHWFAGAKHMSGTFNEEALELAPATPGK